MVDPHERVTLGCSTCRQNAVLWNKLIGEVANEALTRTRPDATVIPPSPGGRVRRPRSGDTPGELRATGDWDVVEASVSGGPARRFTEAALG